MVYSFIVTYFFYFPLHSKRNSFHHFTAISLSLHICIYLQSCIVELLSYPVRLFTYFILCFLLMRLMSHATVNVPLVVYSCLLLFLTFITKHKYQRSCLSHFPFTLSFTHSGISQVAIHFLTSSNFTSANNVTSHIFFASTSYTL